MNPKTEDQVPGKVSKRGLTKLLKEIGQKVTTEHFDDDGGVLTHDEALARLLWRKALGYTEKTRDDNGTEKTVRNRPESWAIQLIYERREGKVMQAQPDDTGRVKAADKVRSLSRERVNKLASKVAGPKGPPSHKPKT